METLLRTFLHRGTLAPAVTHPLNRGIYNIHRNPHTHTYSTSLHTSLTSLSCTYSASLFSSLSPPLSLSLPLSSPLSHPHSHSHTLHNIPHTPCIYSTHNIHNTLFTVFSKPSMFCRGSLTGEYSEEGSTETDSISSLDRTHTLAIGEETGQKERIMDHGKHSTLLTVLM